MHLDAAVGQYIADSSRSQATQRTYRYALNDVLRRLGTNRDCSSLTTADAVNCLKAWGKLPYNTFRVRSAALMGLIGYLDDEGLSPEALNKTKIDRALRKYRPPKPESLPRVLRQDDLDALRLAAHASPLSSPIKERNAALLEVLISTGCRIAEIAALHVRDIDIRSREAIVTGKRQKERKVFMSPQAATACMTYWTARRDRSPDSPAFARHDRGAGKRGCRPITTDGLRDGLESICTLAGVDNVTPHKFRHTFGSTVLTETGNLALVQDLLGHASPETTRIYAKVSAQDLKEAHRRVYG